MQVIKNCRTCGHSEKSWFFGILYCNRSMSFCHNELSYETNVCGKQLKQWIPKHTVTVSFETLEKMQAWETLGG